MATSRGRTAAWCVGRSSRRPVPHVWMAAGIVLTVAAASAALSGVPKAPAPAAARPGAVLRLRLPDLPLPAPPLAAGGRYTVAAGDTLWSIAASAGVSVEQLAAANGLGGDSLLRLGKVLVIPAASFRAPARPAASAPRLRAQPADTPPAAAPRLEAAAQTFVPTGGPSAAGQTAVAGPRRLALVWPSRGVVTSRFGWRVHPIFGGREFHTGVDIATRYGSPVVAARAGVVSFVGWKSGYGRIVVLDHGAGVETMYSHLSAALVGPGQHVAQGQIIGRIGNSGWSTGPHLFFEVRRNGVPLDPSRYLQ